MSGSTDIFKALRGLSEPAVLATLVRTKGSTYRKPGARLLLGQEGPRQGSISAGCLEADIQARVQQVLLTRQPATVRYDMTAELDLLWGTGMGCQGSAEILLEPLFPEELPPWIPYASEHLAQRQPFTLGTVLTSSDPTTPIGSRLAFDPQGQGLPQEPFGLRPLLQETAEQVLATAKPQELTLQVAGGELGLFLETVRPPHALWIYGAGENSRPLAAIAKQLNWEVNILDHRPALATPDRFPGADQLIVGHPSVTMAGLKLDTRSAAVILAHIHIKDQEALRYFLDSGAPYVGLQGNRKRSERILAELEAESGPLTQAQRSRLFYPVGLDLGAETPEDIALSILAEAQATLTGRSAVHLKDRKARIHGPEDPDLEHSPKPHCLVCAC